MMEEKTNTTHLTSTSLQRAEARVLSCEDPHNHLKRAIDHSYAARALKAVLEGDVHALQECFSKVGRVSSDIAVACLMGRHRRLGMHSQFRKIPNYVIRHILSILGSPFDLLNDHVNVVNRHVLNDHSVVNSDGSISVSRVGHNTMTTHVHYCGVIFRSNRRMLAKGWLPSSAAEQVDKKDAGAGAGSGIVAKIFLEDEIFGHTGIPKVLASSSRFATQYKLHEVLPPLHILDQCYREDTIDWAQHDENSKMQKAIEHLSSRILQEVGLKQSAEVIRRVVDGDSLLHISSRIVYNLNLKKQAYNDKAMEQNLSNHLHTRDYLASQSPRISFNSLQEMPKDWKSTLSRYGQVPRGAKVVVGEKNAPTTGCYAASLDMLMKPMEYQGIITHVDLQLGKALPAGSEILIAACECENPNAEETEMRYSVVRLAVINNICMNPTFELSRASLLGQYMITEEQHCKLQEPLHVKKNEYLCLMNRNGPLNLTCSLGDTRRRRLLPNVMSLWVEGKLLPFHQNEVKRGAVGWKAEVEISS